MPGACIDGHPARWQAARAILEELGTPRALTVLRNYRVEGTAAGGWRPLGIGNGSGSAVSQLGAARVWAHRDAGHAILAMGLATQLPQTYPDEPLAWATLAQLLCQHGRYRSAYQPARTALALGYDSELR